MAIIKERYKSQAMAVRDMRITNGLEQRELGQIMGLMGGQYISNIERGLCPFPPKYFKKIRHLKGSSKICRAAVEDFERFWKNEAGIKD